MAIDTVFKRASASNPFPQAIMAWPSGTVDRQAAAWVYVGITAGALASPAYELFVATSDIMKTLSDWSYLMPTLAKNSINNNIVVENSKI
jgi:hypothetical protein